MNRKLNINLNYMNKKIIAITIGNINVNATTYDIGDSKILKTNNLFYCFRLENKITMNRSKIA